MVNVVVEKAMPSIVDSVAELDEEDPEIVYCYNRKSAERSMEN